MGRRIVEDPEDTLDRLRAALTTSNVVGQWEWDLVAGHVVYDTGAAEALAGNAALAGQPLCGEIAVAGIHPEDRRWLHEKILATLPSGGLFLAEYRTVSERRGIRWILSRGTCECDAHGRPLRAYGLLVDVTEGREPGAGYVTRAGSARTDPLEEAADHCLAARRLLREGASPALRLALDVALLEFGRALAMQPPARDDRLH
ncbi:PAS domain-containing protein [Methylobacterium sp. A54F]